MKKILYFLSCLVVLTACRSDKQRRVEAIQHTDSLLFLSDASKLNKSLAMDQVRAYREFAQKYPEDSLAPEFLFKGADLANGLGLGNEAIAMLRELRSEYPKHPRAGAALFMIAFFYENTLQDTANARPAYEEFLRQYPDHRLAESAEFSLRQIRSGMSTDDVGNMFKAQADTAKLNQ